VKGSPDPTDENFVPAWFLLERHRNTPFGKLKVKVLFVFFKRYGHRKSLD